MPISPIRIIIADDHPVLYGGLQSMLNQIPEFSVVATARSFAELDAVLEHTAADVIVLDVLGMGDSPIATISGLQLRFPALKVIVFSSALGSAPDLLRAGARGYITKDEMFDDVVQAIAEVHAGRMFLSQNVRDFIEQARRRDEFTEQELTIMRLNAQGFRTRQIADYLGLAPGTVDNYFNRLYAKTPCASRQQLAAWYREQYGEP